MTLGLGFILVLIALVGGVCITTIGPGGIFVTIALFLLLDIDPATVAGTASVTFIGTGLLGSYAYLRSGQLATRTARNAALILSLTSVVGAFVGARLNTVLDADLFGLLLGAFVLMTGVIIFALERSRARALEAPADFELDSPKGRLAMAGLGLAVGLPGGLLGVGGPVLAVPLMVVLGVPMLLAVALAQVQSIFIAAFAALGFAMVGAIDWGLAVLVGIPLFIGTIAGWVIARRIDPTRLKTGLAFVLVALGIYMLSGAGAT
ncbi:sulfite exporter TauE/SafE family protein [Lujinxingia vulgaris]|uniref:Probable membrane transporter protein n=1 Tax=Lujinxingia vulgaris TaxID=2600176 RepID=A0A5C6XT10_9DELT|nr:sulfite exporter TauE/SafE family protein [Lujinxingia vulgaris]TXD43701.1 sulfite exporter TauE/SafE family protein [Lujinxingia vulgaris]